MRQLLLLIATLLLLLGGRALADPCEAIPKQGPMPAYLNFGATFTGPVVTVLDGDSVCVALGPDHASWVEVRLADFNAPELAGSDGVAAKAALERLALGHVVLCVAGKRTHDRIAARCRIDGIALGDMMLASGVVEGGNGKRLTPGLARRALPPIVTGSAAFPTCAAARAAHAAPVRIGTPGYNPKLDGDHDGVACEPIRKR